MASVAPNLPAMRRIALLVIALALVTAACGDDAETTTTLARVTLPPAALEDEVRDLVAVTEQIRGLAFIEEPVITIVSAEELADRVRAQIEEDLDPTDVAVAQRFYEILGLLDGTVDLGAAYADLYAEQVGGYYDNETGEMVIMGGSDLSPLSKSIVVHELVHALTDQHFSFAEASDALWDAEQFEEATAIQALVEGDATYYQLVYLQSLPVDEQVAAVQESLEVDSTIMDSLPSWFGEDLSFPYDYGFGFVERLVSEGDRTAIDQAYERYPTTTEQILHPEKYLILEPGREVALATADIAGYEVYEEGSFGQWNTRLFLLHGVDLGEAIVASAGWGGDRYRIYRQTGCDAGADCPVAFVYLFVGDTTRDAEELAENVALSAHRIMKVGSARTPVDGVTSYTGGEDFAYVRIDGDRVLFIASDDPAVGQQLVNAFPR